MKILIQNSLFYPNVIGGAEMSSHLLGQELRSRGIAADGVATTGMQGSSTEILTRPTLDEQGTVFEAASHGLIDLYDQGGVPPQPGLWKRALHHLASVYSPRWQKIFGRVLDRCQPDILHTNTIIGQTPVIWKAATERGIPVVHTLRDYHLLCPRTTLLRSDNTDCLSPPLPCRLLASQKLKQTHEVQVVTAPSRFVLEKHTQAGGFSQAIPVVVPNACEYLPAKVPSRDGSIIRGLYLGQLDTHKGIPLLFASLEQLFADSKFDHLQFDFAGKGPAEQEVANFCERYPGRATFHGLVRDDVKAQLVAGASFQVVPSIWNDNFPRSILDGFSWGIPVIGTERGGIPEVIRHGQDGQIIAPESEALTKAMAKYLNDPDLMRKHGKSGRQRAEHFTLDHQVESFIRIYESLLA